MKTIHISKVLSKDLALRDSANRLFELLSEYNEVVLDFSNVRTVTRSFAHQYHTNKSATKTNVKEMHVTPEVKQMFELVDKPIQIQMTHKIKPTKIKVSTLSV